MFSPNPRFGYKIKFILSVRELCSCDGLSGLGGLENTQFRKAENDLKRIIRGFVKLPNFTTTTVCV
jgi:hypothetical protein